MKGGNMHKDVLIIFPSRNIYHISCTIKPSYYKWYYKHSNIILLSIDCKEKINTIMQKHGYIKLKS